MQAQLDYQEQNGEFNARVTELIESAMGADGELLTNSDLFDLLKEQESWSTMSKLSQEIWEEELTHTFAQVSAQVLQTYAEQNGTFISALTGAIEGMTSVIGSKSQPSIKIDYGGGSGGGGSGGGDGGGGSSSSGSSKSSSPTKAEEKFYLPTSVTNAILAAGTQSHYGRYDPTTGAWYRKKYATGGLNTSTGLAWLDGTSSEPEYVLNARQTDAFLRLSEVLPAMMQGGTNTSNTFGGVNLNLVMNVDQIASDYDVDEWGVTDQFEWTGRVWYMTLVSENKFPEMPAYKVVLSLIISFLSCLPVYTKHYAFIFINKKCINNTALISRFIKPTNEIIIFIYCQFNFCKASARFFHSIQVFFGREEKVRESLLLLTTAS